MITVEGVSLNGHPLGNSKAQVLPDATLDFQGLGLEVFNEGLKTLASTPGFSGMEFDIRLRDVRGKKYLYRSQIGVRIEDLKATEYILTPYGTIPDN
jgi:DNA phosphorothioation-dependent restriction protein DptG